MWQTVTLNGILAYRPQAIIDAINDGYDWEDSPVYTAIADVTADVRASVAASGKYKLDVNAASIPSELMAQAVALVIELAKGKINMALTDDEVRLANAAREKLAKIADGNLAVSQPTNPQAASSSAQTGGGGAIISAPSVTFDPPGRLHC